jgi:hypothetical protein
MSKSPSLPTIKFTLTPEERDFLEEYASELNAKSITEMAKHVIFYCAGHHMSLVPVRESLQPADSGRLTRLRKIKLANRSFRLDQTFTDWHMSGRPESVQKLIVTVGLNKGYPDCFTPPDNPDRQSIDWRYYRYSLLRHAAGQHPITDDAWIAEGEPDIPDYNISRPTKS